MPLVILDHVSLAYGHVALLDHVGLVVEPGERIGLIGRNGVGKSSLLKVIAGMVSLDGGTCWRAPNIKVALVPQEPVLAMDTTVFDAVASGMEAHAAMLSDYDELTRRLASGSDDVESLRRFDEIQSQLQDLGGWSTKSRIETLLSQLELDAHTRVDILSGGMKKRVALARALVTDPQLLLLDEPTNHLDIVGIEWLEQLVVGFSGSVLFVTHDRYFLDRVTTRVIELDRGKLASFPQSFSDYQKRKEQMLSAEAQQSAKFDKLLAQEEVWIRKGIEARRTRNEGRVERLQQLRLARAARRDAIGRVAFDVAEGERSGKLVAELQHVSKSYAGNRVIDDFSAIIQRGDKIGLIGPNGVGKTTLLKLMLGEIKPDAGTVRRGSKLAIAYFDQFRDQLDNDATLIEVISPGLDFIEIGATRKHVISYLGDFLFPPQRARAKVSSLSGGERNRLLLARLFAQPANVLVLDEPTNDLDIETLELLEALLQDYSGTLLLVSHDRAFLDNLVTGIISFEGEGKLVEYAGGYSDAVRAQRSRRPAFSVTNKARDDAKKPALRPIVKRTGELKLSQKERRELDALPDLISALEREQTTITARLSDAILYRDEPEQVPALKRRLEQVEHELSISNARWEELETRHSTATTK